jgi:hypothetical protein
VPGSYGRSTRITAALLAGGAIPVAIERRVSAWRSPRTRLVVLASALVVLAEAAAWLLMRSQGNDLGGDQAHYLIAGQALSHFSLHPLAQYQRDFATHFIFNWPSGAKVSDYTIVQTFPGPHGSVFSHGLGLPLLLAPFLAIGSVPLGLLGMFTLTALGFVCIHQRASELAGLGRLGQLLFALIMAAPALWLASTQVYPDLLSGVLLAMVLVEIALIERRRQVSIFGAVIVAVGLAFVPWLQVKYFAPALCCIIAAAIVSLRIGGQRRIILTMAAGIILGWLLLALYNQYYFSHLIGLPQPSPSFTLTTASNTLALIFDAHQGLLVQVPTVVVGLVGLALNRRVIPWTAAAALVGSLSILVINGTFTVSVLGGTALAGRFQWAVLPMLLAWVPLCLVALERHRARLWALGSLVTVLWLVQGIPILRGDHVFVNALNAPFIPWDPTLYPGWWPVVGRWLPTFLPPGIRLGATWSHLFFEVVILAAASALMYRLTRAEKLRLSRPLIGAALATVVALGIAISLPLRTQPTAPLAIDPATHGSPWSATDQTITTPPIGIANVGPGSYRVTMSYGAAPGSGPAVATLMATPPQHVVASGWFTPSHPTDAALFKAAYPPLAPGSGSEAKGRLVPKGVGTVTLLIDVSHQTVLSLYVTVGAGSSFAARSLTLTKLSS